jgi:hypothetical protein
MMRYKQQAINVDLAVSTNKDIAIGLENSPTEMIALWLVTKVAVTWTLSALVNGVAVTLGTGTANTTGVPTKVFSETGPYPLNTYPLSLNISNGPGAAAHVEGSLCAVMRNAFA